MWGKFCKNNSLGNFFKFNDSIDLTLLSETLCSINYQPIINELKQQFHPEKMNITVRNDSNELTENFVRLLQDAIVRQPSVRRLPISISGSKFLQGIQRANEAGSWKALKEKLKQLLESAELVLAGSGTGDAMMEYARNCYIFYYFKILYCCYMKLCLKLLLINL